MLYTYQYMILNNIHLYIQKILFLQSPFCVNFSETTELSLATRMIEKNTTQNLVRYTRNIAFF